MNCGYLSLRSLDPPYWLTEARGQYRTKGEVFSNQAPGPICFVRAYDLGEEARSNDGERLTLPVITKYRPCAQFTEWRQDYSPKDHLELNDAEAIRKSIDRRDQEMRRWQMRLIKLTCAWQLFVAIAGITFGYFIGKK